MWTERWFAWHPIRTEDTKTWFLFNLWNEIVLVLVLVLLRECGHPISKGILRRANESSMWRMQRFF